MITGRFWSNENRHSFQQDFFLLEISPTAMSEDTKRNYAGQPVFTPISHPRLTRYGRLDVYYFLKNREKYLLQIADACKSGAKIEPISLRASIDTELLENALFLQEFGPSINKISELHDDMIESWLKQDQSNSLDMATTDEIEKAVLKYVQIRNNERDPIYRIKCLFISYQKFSSFTSMGISS